MCRWSFRARLPSKSESGTKLSCETSLKKWKWQMQKWSFRARLPSKFESGSCENSAFVRDFPQKVKVEDVRTQLSCETSLKKWKVEDVETKLSCETSFLKIHAFNSIQFSSSQFNSFNSFLHSSIRGSVRFNSAHLISTQCNSISTSIQFIQFKSFLHCFILGHHVINIRNTEVPSNFLWWRDRDYPDLWVLSHLIRDSQTSWLIVCNAVYWTNLHIPHKPKYLIVGSTSQSTPWLTIYVYIYISLSLCVFPFYRLHHIRIIPQSNPHHIPIMKVL